MSVDINKIGWDAYTKTDDYKEFKKISDREEELDKEYCRNVGKLLQYGLPVGGAIFGLLFILLPREKTQQGLHMTGPHTTEIVEVLNNGLQHSPIIDDSCTVGLYDTTAYIVGPSYAPDVITKAEFDDSTVVDYVGKTGNRPRQVKVLHVWDNNKTQWALAGVKRLCETLSGTTQGL